MISFHDLLRSCRTYNRRKPHLAHEKLQLQEAFFFPLGNQEGTHLDTLGTSCYSLSREVIDQSRSTF